MGPRRPPIDRVGFNRKAGRPERRNGTRHMKGRGHQEPALARLRLSNEPREHGILDGIAGLLFCGDAVMGHAERLELFYRQGSFERSFEQRSRPAGKDDAGIGVAQRQFGGRGDAFGGIVERYSAARQRYARRDRAAENNDAVRRTLRGIPRRKAVLQRQDEHPPERRITDKGDEHEARHDQPTGEPPKSREQ